MPEAERVADRNHEIADAQVAGIGQRHLHQVFARHLDHGNVGVRIAADDFGGQFAPVGQGHLDFVSVLDDMEIGQGETVRADHKSASVADRTIAGFRHRTDDQNARHALLVELFRTQWSVRSLDQFQLTIEDSAKSGSQSSGIRGMVLLEQMPGPAIDVFRYLSVILEYTTVLKRH